MKFYIIHFVKIKITPTSRNVSPLRSIYYYLFSWRFLFLITLNIFVFLLPTFFFLITGRLHQVEYAIEAINNAGTCVGLQSTEGIVLAAEKRTVSKLLAPSKTSEKTYTIDDHVVCLVAGLTADANILVQESRLGSQR